MILSELSLPLFAQSPASIGGSSGGDADGMGSCTAATEVPEKKPGLWAYGRFKVRGFLEGLGIIGFMGG